MLFCHFSSADSIRDISNGLRSTTGSLNHLGVTRAPSKSNISYINKHRAHELFKDLYFSLLDKLWQKDTHFRKELGQLRRKVYLMNASVIHLRLSVFEWAKFRSTKGAVRLNTVLDYDGCLPVSMQITDGKMHESQRAGSYSFSKGSVVVVDRGYLDYNWLGDLDRNGCYFVTRSKINMKYKVIKSYQSEALLENGVFKDELIALSGAACNKYSSKPLRLIHFWDSATGNEYHFLTNNTKWKGSLVANIYKQRWHIEVFFKHLKQRLKVSTFIGTSEHAGMIQIWTSPIGILLLKYL